MNQETLALRWVLFSLLVLIYARYRINRLKSKNQQLEAEHKILVRKNDLLQKTVSRVKKQ